MALVFLIFAFSTAIMALEHELTDFADAQFPQLFVLRIQKSWHVNWKLGLLGNFVPLKKQEICDGLFFEESATWVFSSDLLVTCFCIYRILWKVISYPVLSTDNMQSMLCFMSLKRTKLQSSNNPELDSWADFILNYSQMFVLCSFHWMPLKQVTTATWSLYNGFCRIVCRFFSQGFFGIEDFSIVLTPKTSTSFSVKTPRTLERGFCRWRKCPWPCFHRWDLQPVFHERKVSRRHVVIDLKRLNDIYVYIL